MSFFAGVLEGGISLFLRSALKKVLRGGLHGSWKGD